MSGVGCARTLDQTGPPGAVTRGPFARSPRMERHAPLDTSRQPDPAAPAPFPEYGAATDARGPAGPVLDIGVEHGARRVAAFLTYVGAVVTVLALGVGYADPTPLGLTVAVLCTVVTLVARRAWIGRPEVRYLPAGRS